jgi:hypothetical protein
MMEYFIYAGAIILVTVLVTLWIATARQPLEDSRHRPSDRRVIGGGWRSWFRRSDGSKASGKRRRRRRSDRKRNPTLAETGGLPPIRSQSAPAPGTPPP